VAQQTFLHPLLDSALRIFYVATLDGTSYQGLECRAQQRFVADVREDKGPILTIAGDEAVYVPDPTDTGTPQRNQCVSSPTPPAACYTGHVDPRPIMDVGVMNGNIPAPMMAIEATKPRSIAFFISEFPFSWSWCFIV